MKSIAKCNKYGFVYKYTQRPSEIRCRGCGSNESLSVRQGIDVISLLRTLIGQSCQDYFRLWHKLA